MAPVSVTVFASNPGNYFFEDDGVPGNNFSRIRFPDGTIIPFEHPTNDLFFTPSVPGVFLTVDFTDSLGAANFTVGNLTDAAQTPDSIVMNRVNTTGIVTLVSNGPIIESDADAGADIVAGTLIMNAGTGIGTPGNAIETQAGAFEADTNTGGINVINFGTVQIGAVSADVSGLNVVTSGNINFTNYGTIVLADETGFESVHGGNISGNVVLTAVGFDSDVIASVDQDSISAAGGAINLTAGRDVAFGTIGANFDNDVRASGVITINAGRDFLIDGFADLASDGFGNDTGGNVIITAGRNIGALNVTGSDASIVAGGTAGADVILTTGAGGTLTANSGSGSAAFASIGSDSGDVTVNADRIAIGASGAIAATNGQVILRTATAGRAIDVGSASDGAFAMELSDAELDRIFAPTLTIGSVTAGSLAVSAALSPLNVTNLTLQSGEDVTISSAVTITDTLTARARDDLFLLTGASISATVFNGFVDQDGAADAAGGIGTLNGIVSAVSTLTGNVNADTLNGSDSANTLNGAAGNDTLRGFGGADTHNGGAGNDAMFGGLGDDKYFVDNAGDDVFEAAGEGIDRVFASVSYQLGAGEEIEILNTTSNGGTGAINLVGNEFAQTIVGNAGDNIINGLGGIDTMQGLGGDDRYHVDNSADVIVEALGGGTDRVLTSTHYSLDAGVEVETLSTNDANATTALKLAGNSYANNIIGNSGNNFINGAGGADTLTGWVGDDIFMFNTALGGGNIDDITDFNVADDTIRLENAIFANIVGTGVLTAAQFVANASGAAQDANDRIIYETDTGRLIYDANGSTAGGRFLFATLDAGLAVTNADFFVV